MRNRILGKLKQHKKGSASFYIVMFATLLFGVITVSFIRLVLSEAGQSSNDDLSRSAYDAAMAGVEDAKTAVNHYYECIGNGGTTSSCNRDVLFRDSCDGIDGIGLARYLYRDGYSSGEVLIQQNGVGSSVDNSSDQAYTCVIISDVVPDYRGTLTSDTRTKVVPLKIYDGATSGSPIDTVSFEWYSSLNEGAGSAGSMFRTYDDDANDVRFRAADETTIPPVIQLTYVKIGPNINIDNFHRVNSTGDYEYSTMLLVPNSATDAGAVLEIGNDARSKADNVNNVDKHTPFAVTCSTTAAFACSVKLTDANIGPDDSAFLIVSLPYGETISDFAVTLYSGGNIQEFEGVQISVDSTGRTNQLVRRVETRLDPADLFFPYPQYALELSGDGGEALKKDFWITANCWYSQPSTGGNATQCPNNGG